MDKEENRKAKSFMDPKKRQWNEQFPEKIKVARQILQDNAIRFKMVIRKDIVVGGNTEERGENNSDYRIIKIRNGKN